MDIIMSDSFRKGFKKLDNTVQIKVFKQIMKLDKGNYVKKHMVGNRKGTMEFYVGSFRMPFKFKKDDVILLKIYPKDKQ